MKFLIAFALAVVAHADVSHLKLARASSGSDVDAQVLRSESDVGPESFSYALETSNGIAAQATGQLQNQGREDEAFVIQGSNQHTSPEGEVVQLTFIADQNGYQPQGSHLPTPPPTQAIPEYILRSLEYIRTHAPADEQTRYVAQPQVFPQQAQVFPKQAQAFPKQAQGFPRASAYSAFSG